MRTAPIVAILVLVTMILSGCSVIKASPAVDSGFLGKAGELASANSIFPFNRVWGVENLQEELRNPNVLEIAVAPVDLSHLSARKEETKVDHNNVGEIAEYARETFEHELKQVETSALPAPAQTDKRQLTLELSLVELKPTDVARSVFGTVLGSVVPGGSLFSLGVQGTVAIEGKLVDPETKEIVFAFADRESGKVAPINLNDFRLYSHARVAIKEWAEQYSQILKGRATKPVRDSLPLTLLPI